MRVERTVTREHTMLERSIEEFWGMILLSGSDDNRGLFLRIANIVVRLERVQHDLGFGTPVSRLELIRIGRMPVLRRLEVPSVIMTLCGEWVSPFDLHQSLTSIAPICWEIILSEYWCRFADHGSSARTALMTFGEAILDLAEDDDGVQPRTLCLSLANAIRPLAGIPPAVRELVGEDATDAQRLRIARDILRPTVERLLSEFGHIRQTMPPPPPSGPDVDPSSSVADDEGPASVRHMKGLIAPIAGFAAG